MTGTGTAAQEHMHALAEVIEMVILRTSYYDLGMQMMFPSPSPN